MAGRPYELKEMRAIVDYLVEHKAYGETKARKMWIDMQDSKITNRTWQSLKETFLKRILPDIHNPYYKLSLEQISSFKQGYDIEKRINNKLQFEASSESNTDDDKQKNKENPDLDKNGDKAGEDLHKSKSDLRASTETLVLEPINPEDREPSPVKEPVKEIKESKKFPEPLIPILQAVLDDFNTSEEDDEPRMQIVEAEPLDVTLIENSQNTHKDSNKDIIDLTEEKNNAPLEILNKNDVSNNDVKETQNNLLTDTINLKTSNKITQNGSNSTTDTIIPDNQEALKNKTIEGTSETSKSNERNQSKRRASSQDIPISSKKRLLSSDKKYTSDMDTIAKKKRNLSLKKLSPSSKIQDLGEQSLNSKSQSGVDNNMVQNKGNYTSNEILKLTQPSDVDASANSASLQAGQGSKRKSTDLENSCVQKKSKDKVEKDSTASNMSRNGNDIVVSGSHSEPVSEQEIENRARDNAVQRQRGRAVAKMFGFTTGAVSRSRKKRSSHRKSRNHTFKNVSTESSAWTSEEDSDYVSPPRGRKNKHARKYLKPKSARILSLEEEGGLFVVYGKKIYPIVKDGKIIKNYVNLMEEDDDDQEESYWKLKYIELKKKEEARSKNVTSPDRLRIGSGPTNAAPSDPMVVKPADGNKAETSKETLKLKFTVNDAKVEVEGSSSLVNPMIEQVVQLLHKPPENVQPKIKPKPVSESSSTQSSEIVVISDQEARERVDRLERAIFKQIESEKDERVSVEKETKTNVIAAPENVAEQNVTVRKTRAKKQSSTPNKRIAAKKPVNEGTESNSNENKPPTRRSTRARKQSLEDKTQQTGDVAPRNRQSASKDDGEDENRYRLPSPQPSKRKSYNNKNKQQKSDRSPSFNFCFAPKNASLGSKENSLGSSEYDPSPIPLSVTKRINTTYSIPKTYTVSKLQPTKLFKKQMLRPNMTNDITSDSSNSFQGSIKSLTFHNSSLSSNVHRSESYQLLMNNVTLRKKPNKCPTLNIIDEATPSDNQDLFNIDEFDNTDTKDAISNANTDISSNNTMPTSPILSIVENISIGKNFDNFDFGEPEYMMSIHQDATDQVGSNNPKSHVDVSMPLLQQDSAFHHDIHEDNEYHYNIGDPETSVTESLIRKVKTVEIGKTKFSETINNKLENLVLESNKKKRKDDTNKKQNNPEAIIVKTKRRSSTPLKRQNKRKTKNAKSEPCIEEERTEACSQRNLKACPTKRQNIIDIPNDDDDSSAIELNIDKTKKTVTKKKNVIKVKITKPKRISKSMECIQNAVDRDSGINDIEASNFLSVDNVDIDLIHNHSDTCINPEECYGNSVEIVEDPTKSIISVDNSHSIIDSECYGQLPDLTSHFYCHNAQDGCKIRKVIVNEIASKQDNDSPSYKTAIGSPDSLITEDLSNEPSPKPARAQSNWYLLSEEDTTNASDVNSYGANLNQIFPITCAIPNLSTITEMSKENDHNSRKCSEDAQANNDYKDLFDF